jgi:hypothetical protein
MNVEERLVADYAGTGMTVGKRPMHCRRAELRRSNILSAQELHYCTVSATVPVSVVDPGVPVIVTV